MKTKPNYNRALFVFKNDLRILDHELLRQACHNSQSIQFLFCLQPWEFESAWLDGTAMGSARYRFLWQSVQDLNQLLAGHGHTLVVRLGRTEKVIKELQCRYRFTHVYHSHSAGYYEHQQWQLLAAEYPDVVFKSQHIQSLYASDQLPFDVAHLPKHFTPFRKATEKLAMHVPVVAPAYWPESVVTETNQLNLLPKPTIPCSDEISFFGGQTEGLGHLESYMSSIAPSTYKLVRNELMGWSNSTKFSPWLALGCISPRQIMQRLQAYETTHGANDSTYWIFFELLWREFFYWNGIKQGRSLFQTPQVFWLDKTALKRLYRWCLGETGEGLIDACMRQLNQTGYLSNRGRQIAASYLIHEAAVDWRAGASYFERMLLDYDVASNWGNWQYIAGVGADPRGGRHFNIQKQQQTHDPKGTFIELWSEVETHDTQIAWDDLSTR